MRITFDASTTETLEYLRTAVAVMKNNKEVSDEVKAFNGLKKLVENINDRLNKLEADNRRNVCR